MRNKYAFFPTAILAGGILIAPAAGIAAAGTTAAPAPAPAASEAPVPPAGGEIDRLRRELEALRDEVRALREQVAVLSGPESGAPPAPGVVPPAPAPVAPAPTPPPVPPQPAAAAVAPARSQNLLNPAISAVFQAIGNTSLKRGDDVNGFDLSEAELAFESVVDPYAKVNLYLSFPAAETPEVEEGFVTTLALPGPLQLRGGRYKNALGKWNTLHTHAFFTVERPNALVNFLGEESLTTDGLSLSVLIPNPWDLYLDSITEVGTALPGAILNTGRRNLHYLEHLAAFFNPSPDSTLEVGLSASLGEAGPTEALIEEIRANGLSATLTPRDELDAAVLGLDVTYKWKPLRLNVYRSFLWQTEVLRSRRDLETLSLQPMPALVAGTVSSLGGYSYLEAQFSRRWRYGIRYDLSGFPDSETAREWAASGVVRFQPSEFQELRFQVKHTRRNGAAAAPLDERPDDTRVFFEWIPVIGAHGAHKY